MLISQDYSPSISSSKPESSTPENRPKLGYRTFLRGQKPRNNPIWEGPLKDTQWTTPIGITTNADRRKRSCTNIGVFCSTQARTQSIWTNIKSTLLETHQIKWAFKRGKRKGTAIQRCNWKKETWMSALPSTSTNPRAKCLSLEESLSG